MRSLECRIGLLNPHTHAHTQTHINKHAYVQKQRSMFGSVLSKAAGSQNVCLSVFTCVRAPAE